MRPRRSLGSRLSALLASAAALLGPTTASAVPPESPPEPPDRGRDPADAETGEREAPAPPPPAQGGDSDFEVVRPGDSLWSVAERVLGEERDEAAVAAEAGRLWRLNADRIGIGDPEVLLPGTVLRLR